MFPYEDSSLALREACKKRQHPDNSCSSSPLSKRLFISSDAGSYSTSSSSLGTGAGSGYAAKVHDHPLRRLDSESSMSTLCRVSEVTCASASTACQATRLEGVTRSSRRLAPEEKAAFSRLQIVNASHSSRMDSDAEVSEVTFDKARTWPSPGAANLFSGHGLSGEHIFPNPKHTNCRKEWDARPEARIKNENGYGQGRFDIQMNNLEMKWQPRLARSKRCSPILDETGSSWVESSDEVEEKRSKRELHSKCGSDQTTRSQIDQTTRSQISEFVNSRTRLLQPSSSELGSLESCKIGNFPELETVQHLVGESQLPLEMGQSWVEQISHEGLSPFAVEDGREDNGPRPSYVLSSGRLSLEEEARLGRRAPTIDHDFEEYFSALML